MQESFVELTTSENKWVLCSVLPHLVRLKFNEKLNSLDLEESKVHNKLLLEIVTLENSNEQVIGSLDANKSDTLKSIRLRLLHCFPTQIPSKFLFLYKGAICGLYQESRRGVSSCRGRIFIVQRDSPNFRKKQHKNKHFGKQIEKQKSDQLSNSLSDAKFSHDLSEARKEVSVTISHTTQLYHVKMKDTIKSFLSLLVPNVSYVLILTLTFSINRLTTSKFYFNLGIKFSTLNEHLSPRVWRQTPICE